jgi:hypothetical protein
VREGVFEFDANAGESSGHGVVSAQSPYGLNTTAGVLNSEIRSTTGKRILDGPGGKAAPEETNPFIDFMGGGGTEVLGQFEFIS